MTRSHKTPPGPRGVPILGTLPYYLKDALGFVTGCARRYGDIVHYNAMGLSVYQLNHPDLIEQVLVQNHHSFIKERFTRDLSFVIGNGLLVSEGDFWRRQRRMAQPAFQPRQVERYAEVMVDCAERRTADWHAGQHLNVHEEMTHVTMEIVARTLFDTELRQEAAEIGRSIDLLMTEYLSAGGVARIFLPKRLKFLGLLPTPSVRRQRAAIRRFDEILLPIIQQRRASGLARQDLLSMLLHAQDQDGSQMTDRQLRDEAVTLFVAGHETTALALSYAWYLLALHPEKERCLHDELDSVLGGRRPGVADLPCLPYAEWVVKEAMRLYPPAWGIGREATEDVEIGGYAAPKGTQMFLYQWVMHRDPRYFDEPEAFVPERWDNDLARRLPRFAYFPFGGGPRVCIGNHFAMTEATLVLATIAQRFRLELVPGFQLQLVPSITLRPRHGIPMLVSERQVSTHAGGSTVSRLGSNPPPAAILPESSQV